MTPTTESLSHPARRIALFAVAALVLTAAVISFAAATAVAMGLAVLAALAAGLRRAIRGDGYGQRRPPRGVADVDDSRAKTLTGLAR